MSDAPRPQRQVLERWGQGGFVVSGTVYSSPILILPGRTLIWNATDLATATPDSLAPIAESGGIDILLLGTGAKMGQVPVLIRKAFRQVGIVIEAMDTPAACRTYSILLAEDRRIAAALLPLGA